MQSRLHKLCSQQVCSKDGACCFVLKEIGQSALSPRIKLLCSHRSYKLYNSCIPHSQILLIKAMSICCNSKLDGGLCSLANCFSSC